MAQEQVIRTRYGRGAFSMLELVLVLAIIGTLAAMAAPRYASALADYRAQSAAKRIAADLALAKSRAKATSTTVSMTFSPASGSYTIAGLTDLNRSAQPYTIRLKDEPYRAVLLSAFPPDGQISFDGYGMPSAGGSVVVTVGDFTKTITLNAQTGEILIP